jgi:photosystem II stability/assembly factor-like uncharacterized protein
MPNIVYAGLQDGGICRSTDGGVHWESVLFKTDSYIGNIIATPEGIYAASHNIGLRRSQDHGVTWDEIGVAHEVRVNNVFFSPHGDGLLLVNSQDARVFIGQDSGERWQEATGDLPREWISCLAASGSDEYWAGQSNGFDGGLYHTTDGGRHWEKATLPQPPDTDVFSVLIDNDDPQTVYVSLGNVHNEGRPPEHDYLFITHDGGESWQPLPHPYDGGSGFWWFLTHSPDGAIYLSAALTVYRSTDQGATWTEISFKEPLGGIGTGDIHRMAIDPTNPDTLYLPLLNGVGKSTDGGKTWSLHNEGMVFTRINLLATHAINPGTIFAAASGGEGTFRSTDYGGHWTWLNKGGLLHPWVDELVADPVDTETVYEIVDISDVYRSTDGGDIWNQVWADFHYSSISALSIAPSDPDIIYALKNGFGIFKSEDGGNDWRFLHQSGIDYTYSIAVHPQNPDVVFSGYNPKPFQDWAMVRRSFDGGYSWETVLKVPQSAGITSIAIDSNNPDTVYAGSVGEEGGSIFKSTDGGDTWTELNENFIMCTVWGQPQLIVDPDDPSVAYAATWLAGTWKTTDAGTTWTLLREAPVSATALSFNAQNSDVIYLADRTAPIVWKSTDAGATWQKVADFSRDRAFLLNRVFADGDTVYAATFGPGLHAGKLYKSTDAGSTWVDITGILPRSVLDVAVDPTDPDIIYVTTHIYGAYKSINGGNTWVEMQGFPNIGAYDIEVDTVDPTIMYACGLSGSVPDWCMGTDTYTFTDGAGAYKSIDSGSTWNQILTTSNECRAIRLHPNNHNMLFAVAMDDGLQVSIDGGNSWTSYNTGLGTQVLTSCAVNGDKIYVGSQASGVYSGDIDMDRGSVTWKPGRSNKPVPEVYSLQIEVDPAASDRIFVGSNPGGLYRSDDGGVTFYDKNFLTPTVIVDDPYRQGYYTFALNPSDTSEIWLGTWGKGVFKSYDNMDFDITAHGNDREMLGKHIYQIVVDPRPPHAVYAATEEGVYRTTDGGATWHDISNGLDTSQIRTLTLSPNGALYAGSLGYGLYRYDSGAAVWRQMAPFRQFGTFWPIWDDRPLYQYSSLLINPIDNQTMYLGTFPAGIYKTTDGGANWREHNVGWTNDGVFSLVFHPEDMNIVYAGTYNGVNRSADGGEHWEMWDNGWPAEQWVFSIAFDPRDPNVMYACSKNGEDMGRGRDEFRGTIMKSTDGGASWSPITTGLNINQEFYNIIVDPVSPDTLYLATQGEGVFISRDGGNHWSPWNEGLANLVSGSNGNNVTNVLALSADGKVIYFGTSGSGVWRRGLDR